VRLLAITISSDKHVSNVSNVSNTSSFCFYWLRQIRRIRRSLDTESAKTLVYAFVLCWPGLQRPSLIVFRRVLNAAAGVVNGTRKFDRGLTHLLHCELHWLDVPQRIQFKLGVTVRRCLQGNAPQYLVNLCLRLMFSSRQRLRLCKSPSAHRATTPSHQVRSSGVFCSRPDSLELAARLSP